MSASTGVKEEANATYEAMKIIETRTGGARLRRFIIKYNKAAHIDMLQPMMNDVLLDIGVQSLPLR